MKAKPVRAINKARKAALAFPETKAAELLARSPRVCHILWRRETDSGVRPAPPLGSLEYVRVLRAVLAGERTEREHRAVPEPCLTPERWQERASLYRAFNVLYPKPTTAQTTAYRRLDRALFEANSIFPGGCSLINKSWRGYLPERLSWLDACVTEALINSNAPFDLVGFASKGQPLTFALPPEARRLDLPKLRDLANSVLILIKGAGAGASKIELIRGENPRVEIMLSTNAKTETETSIPKAPWHFSRSPTRGLPLHTEGGHWDELPKPDSWEPGVAYPVAPSEPRDD